MSATRFLLVDDHPAIRHGLKLLLDNEPGFSVCAEAGDAREAREAFRQERPDFVILDISLADSPTSGLSLITEFCSQAAKDLPILIYSMHDETVYAERVIRAGAKGYLMKQSPVRQVIESVREILTTGLSLSPAMKHRMLSGQVGSGTRPGPGLTPQECLMEREFEVFCLLGRGLSPRRIAEHLHLSAKTIETHRMHIREKLGLSEAADVLQFAVDWVKGNT
ncbi:MAG: response regulator transcription factor [Desulfohalobiaceae bacterium]|nr:response regulator transcription factor [Desulfohalobiaceae bacterium]